MKNIGCDSMKTTLLGKIMQGLDDKEKVILYYNKYLVCEHI